MYLLYTMYLFYHVIKNKRFVFIQMRHQEALQRKLKIGMHLFPHHSMGFIQADINQRVKRDPLVLEDKVRKKVMMMTRLKDFLFNNLPQIHNTLLNLTSLNQLTKSMNQLWKRENDYLRWMMNWKHREEETSDTSGNMLISRGEMMPILSN